MMSARSNTRVARSFGMAAVMALMLVVTFEDSEVAVAAPAPVNLATSSSFAVLAGSTVTNTGSSTISGDLGVSPGTAVTGFPPGTVINGAIHSADAVAAQAQADLTIAYNDAAGRPPSGTITADLGGQTLVAGVYRGATLGLTGTLSLDAQGDPNAVFIFQSASTLITASASSISLLNGAQACNVFWQVGSSATLGTNSSFRGTILALASVTTNTGAAVTGRLLARSAAVTLDTNAVTRPGCLVVPPTTIPVTTTTIPVTTTTIPVTTTTIPVTTTTVPGTTTTVPGTTTTVPGTTTTTVPGTITTSSTPVTTSTTTTPATTRTTTTTKTTTVFLTTSSVGAKLPRTGSDLATPVIASFLAVVLGALMIFASNRGTSEGGLLAIGTDPGLAATTTKSSRVASSASSVGAKLPRTGSDVATTVIAGFLAVVLGALMIFASKRGTSERGPRLLRPRHRK